MLKLLWLPLCSRVVLVGGYTAMTVIMPVTGNIILVHKIYIEQLLLKNNWFQDQLTFFVINVQTNCVYATND